MAIDLDIRSIDVNGINFKSAVAVEGRPGDR